MCPGEFASCDATDTLWHGRAQTLQEIEMVSYRFSEHDLTAAIFGVSVLSESTLSLRAVWRPEVHPHMSPSRRAVEPSSRASRASISRCCWRWSRRTSPSLSSSTRPAASTADLDELATVSRLSARIVDGDLDDLYPSGRPAALGGPTARVLGRIVRALDEYGGPASDPGGIGFGFGYFMGEYLQGKIDDIITKW